MSLSSLADQEISRRETKFLQARMQPVVQRYAASMAKNFNIPSGQLAMFQENLSPLAAESPLEPTTMGQKTLDALTRYIPTEAITLYVAACSTMVALTGKIPPQSPYWIYWIFVLLTPLLFLLILAGKRRGVKLPPFPAFKAWPWWKLIAATIAFGVWSLAVPGTPYLQGEVGRILAAFLAVFVSTFLTLLEPIFQTTPETGA